MSQEARSFYTKKNLDEVAKELSQWLERDGFPTPKQSYGELSITILAELAGTARRAFGQVRKLNIKLIQIKGGFQAIVDDGGIEKYAGTLSHLPLPVLSWISAGVSTAIGVAANFVLMDRVFEQLQFITARS